jgi:hypothetical protein
MPLKKTVCENQDSAIKYVGNKYNETGLAVKYY